MSSIYFKVFPDQTLPFHVQTYPHLSTTIHTKLKCYLTNIQFQWFSHLLLWEAINIFLFVDIIWKAPELELLLFISSE